MTFTLTPISVKKSDGTATPMIAYNDGTNNAFANAQVDATGAIISPATSGLQTTANSTLATIATQTNGVATAAKQDTGNTSLATIATTNTNLDTNLGAKADTAASSDTGTFSLIALFKRSLQTLTSISTSCQAATPAGTNLIGKVGIDQTTPGTTNLVYLPAPLIVTGGTTTRPADTTAYTAGDLVANSTTAGSVTYPTIAAARANDLAGTVLRLRLKKSGTTLTNGIFRVHLYNVLPSVTNGDNGAWVSTTAGYVGSFDVTMTQAFSDSAMGIGTPTAGSGVAFAPVTGTQNLYYLIEARAAYTPSSSEVFTPIVEVQ